MADDGVDSEIGDATEEIPEYNREQSVAESRNNDTPVNDSENVDNATENVVSETLTQEEEPDSFMTELVADGLSQLGRSADGTMQVFLTLTLNGKGLTDISALKSYKHLQTVNISHNNLQDLTALGHMEHLIKLDASHNKLTTILDFKPPKNLLDVNLSHNKLDKMTDLVQHKHLVKLILDHNHITEIRGLSSCSHMKYLSIAHNHIEKMSGLANLPLTYLNLSNNRIKKIENIETLKYLKVLDLSKNNIRNLKGLQNHEFLQDINLEGNQLIDIAEIRYIRELRLLRNLNLVENPIQEMPDYRMSILFRLQMLVVLDQVEVTASEKVHAINMFNPPRDVIAARDHMVHVVRSLVQPARVFDSTLTSPATPYPMLVLTGPVGAGKRFLTKKLCQEFPDYFGLGVSTTTRPRRKKEENGVDYHFTSQDNFEKDVMEGKFLQTAQSAGYWYGITREAIECVARRGLACTLHMEFEGVLSLRNTSFEPRYILILPETPREHERRLRDNCNYSESIISQALDRVQLYTSTNSDKPGFFDMTIMSDDLNEVYKRLKMLVLEYLGMSPSTTTESECVINSFTNTPRDSRGSEGAPTGSSTTTTMSRPWSRPRSTVSNNNGGASRSIFSDHQSAKISSVVEQESLQRRRALAKAALAGIPYVSKEQLHAMRFTENSTKDFSTLFKLERSVSAPVEYNSSYFSLLANVSNLTSNGRDQLAQNGLELLDSDTESLASSSTPSSARAFSAGHVFRADTPDSGDSRPYSESLGTLAGSGSGPREDILGNSI